MCVISWYVWIFEYLDVTAIRFWDSTNSISDKINSQIIRVLRISWYFLMNELLSYLYWHRHVATYYISIFIRLAILSTNLTQIICTIQINADYISIFGYLKYSAVSFIGNLPLNFYRVSQITELLELLHSLFTLKFCQQVLQDAIKKVSGIALWKNNWLILFTVIPFNVIPSRVIPFDINS